MDEEIENIVDQTNPIGNSAYIKVENTYFYICRKKPTLKGFLLWCRRDYGRV